MKNEKHWRKLQINGGVVHPQENGFRLQIPAGNTVYTDAQIDDYGGRRRAAYPWSPALHLSLRARFSHGVGRLSGTAGFGFWNAPFGDPTVPWPTLPQAVWFFYGSPPTDLPLAHNQPGRGWFAGTLDAGSPRALLTAPLALPVLLLNQSRSLRNLIWPWVQKRLGVTFQPVTAAMTEWQSYELFWAADGCRFLLNGEELLQTSFAPRGPLGFVCWIDNQFMVAQPHGRLRGGILPVAEKQWMEIDGLQIQSANL